MISFKKNYLPSVRRSVLVAGGLVSLLGCDTEKQIKVDQITINEAPVKVEVIKNINQGPTNLGTDTYTINIYDSSGSLRAFVTAEYLNEAMFVHKDSTGNYVVRGNDPRFDVKN